MATEGKSEEDTLSDLESLRAILVRNLPSDVDKDLLQCLFPEASEIKLNDNSHGKHQRSSIIIFPKVSNALYYADQDRSIQLDQNLLSIQSLVHTETSSTSKEPASPSHSSKERASSSHSQERDRERGHDKDHSRDRSSQASRSRNHHRSSHRQSSSVHRSLSPPYHSKPGDDVDARLSSHREAPSRTRATRYEDFFHRPVPERMVVLRNLPPTVSKPTLLSIIPKAWDITLEVDPEDETNVIGVVEFYTEKDATQFLRKNRNLKLDHHLLTVEPYKFDQAAGELDSSTRIRSQSPPFPPRRRVRSPPTDQTSRRRSPLLPKPSLRRSRSPLLPKPPRHRSRSPLLPRPSLRRSRSPLLPRPSRHRSRSPPLSEQLYRRQSRSPPSLNQLSRRRSRSPLLPRPSRRRSRSPLLPRPSRHRSRSPLLPRPSRHRSRSPLLPRPSRHRSRSPLLPLPSGRCPLLPIPRSESPVSRHRSPQRLKTPLYLSTSSLIETTKLKKRGQQADSQRRKNLLYLSTTTSVETAQFKKRGPPPENDKYHFTAKQPDNKSDDGGGGGGDRRFVSITSRVNEKINSKKWTRYFEHVAQAEQQQTFSGGKNKTKAKGIFNQFKDQAKKFASENPHSARALNELLVALGHTKKTDLDPSYTSSLDDLQKAFSPEDNLHADTWFENLRKFDHKKSSDTVDLQKQPSVLEQVKDLSLNLGILSQLSKLAKHLKADRTDSSAATKASSALEDLVSKATWADSNCLQDESRSKSRNKKRKRGTHFSPMPKDNFFKSAGKSDLHSDEAYLAIDYNHQKPADKMGPKDRTPHSTFIDENYDQNPYDDSCGFKDYEATTRPGNRSEQDYETSIRSGHRNEQDYEEATHSGHRNEQDYLAASRLGHRREQNYETASQSSHRTEQDYDAASRSIHRSDQDYVATNRSGHRTGLDYEAVSRSGHRTGQDYELANRSGHRNEQDYEGDSRSVHRSGQDYEEASQSGHRTGQDYGVTSQSGRMSVQDYEGSNRSCHRTGQDYDVASQSSHRSGQDYEASNRSVHRTGQDYDVASQSSHRSGQDYEASNRSVHRNGQDYEVASQSSHRSGQDYEVLSRSGHRSGQDYETASQSDHRPRQDYEAESRQGHRTGQDYDTTNQTGHRTGLDYETTSRLGHRTDQDYETASRSGLRTDQDFENVSRSSHRPVLNQEQYDQRSLPFEESSHTSNNWHQNLGPTRQSGPCDPREFGLMDHDDRVWSGVDGPNEFPHDTDGRFNQMPPMNQDDGYRHDLDDRQDNIPILGELQPFPDGKIPHPLPDDVEVETNEEGKPIGWRHYSMGVKTFRWK